ncbi:MAG: hypothetical protein HRU20_31565 [Pseudomonadales bacterium]|nr:hypothetical protein [Pseudomonadales bacterium]
MPVRYVEGEAEMSITTDYHLSMVKVSQDPDSVAGTATLHINGQNYARDIASLVATELTMRQTYTFADGPVDDSEFSTTHMIGGKEFYVTGGGTSNYFYTER